MRLLPEPSRLLRFVFLSSINPEKRQIQAIHTCETKDDPLKLGLLSEIPLGNIFYSIKYDSKIYVGFDLSRLEKVIKNKFYFKRSFAITIVSRLRFEIIQTLIQVTLFPTFRPTKFSPPLRYKRIDIILFLWQERIASSRVSLTKTT